MSIDKIRNIGLDKLVTQVYDFDSLTTDELMCKFAQKINIIIEHFNYLDKQCQNNNESMKLKLEYLLGQGLEEQVAKRLIELINNGTLGKLINETLLRDINEKLDTKTKKSNIEVFDNDYNLSLQEIIDSDLGISKLTLNKNSVYDLTDTLLIPSNFELNLNGATLKLKGIDKPVISKKGNIQGRTIVRNGKINGDITMPNNKGIEINDHYSTFRDLEIQNTGAQGIHCINGSATGNLVENVFKNIIFRNCQGIAFECEGGNKITDGVIDNFIIHGASVNKAIKIGNSAGWIINKIHTYGFGSVGGVIDIQNGYNTNISDIYIEGSGGSCMSINAIQQSVNLNNVTIVCSDNTTSCILLNKSSATSYDANINISNLNIVNNVDKSINSIESDGTNVNCSVSNLSIQGTYKDNVVLGSKIKSKTKLVNNAYVIGTLKGENGALSLDGNNFAPYVSKKWSGSGEKTITIPLTRLGTYEKIPFNISIFSQKWDSQGGQVKFVASGLISTSSSVTTNAVTSLELGTSIGLTNKPTYVLDTTLKTLTITFTPSATDNSDQGILYIQFGY